MSRFLGNAAQEMLVKPFKWKYGTKSCWWMTIRICWRSIATDLRDLLPSQPEIHTAASGARAMAMLEKDAYRLIVTDLKMPKMDGLQLLSVVRRKYPELRTVVLTSVVDEQFRSRVYALGVDLYWHKPGSEQR
jgi:CheY-like chemotaxis protein